MSFPFLRLPQVVLSIIINLAEPNQLICLTQCSKRSYNLVKTYRKKLENVEILVDDYENAVKVFFDKKVNCRLRLDSVNGNRKLVKREYPTTNLFGADFRLSKFMSSIWYLKWDDPTKDGVLTLIDWATDLFRTDVWCLFVSKETFHRLKWVKRRQGRIEKLYLSGGEYTEKEIRNMIHSNAENLLFNYITPRFEYPGTLPSRTSFVSGRGFLFTQNHLMTSDFMELSVSYSSLTNSNVNQFLKHWLAGGSPRLKTLSLEIDGVDINEITRGIEGIIPNETLRSEEYWTISGRELTFNDRMYLKRSDGVIATCCIHHPELLFARKMFVLAVWPDAKNNACLIDTFQLL